MLDKITIELLDKWGACKRMPWEKYSDKNLHTLFAGKDYITPLEVLKLNIPIKDKIWVLLHKEILGDQLMDPINKAVDRARKCADNTNINLTKTIVKDVMNDIVNIYIAIDIIADVIADSYVGTYADVIADSYVGTYVDYYDDDDDDDYYDYDVLESYTAEIYASAHRTERNKQLADIRMILEGRGDYEEKRDIHTSNNI
jgi:hypothetical protein